jgi:hypothetical protein
VVTLGVSTAVGFTTASIDFNGGVLVWFTWSWFDASGGNSSTDFFVVQTLTKITLGSFVFVPSVVSLVDDTADFTRMYWWLGSWGTGNGTSSSRRTSFSRNGFTFVSFTAIVKHTGDKWSKWSFTFTNWSGWTKRFIAFANFISATVLWSSLEATVWSSVVWSAVGVTVVLWEGAAIDVFASSFSTDSLWATTVVLDTFINLIFITSGDHRFITSRSNLFERDTFGLTGLVTDTWEAGRWNTVPWLFFTSSQINVPSVTNWNFETEVIDTFMWWWWGNGG